MKIQRFINNVLIDTIFQVTTITEISFFCTGSPEGYSVDWERHLCPEQSQRVLCQQQQTGKQRLRRRRGRDLPSQTRSSSQGSSQRPLRQAGRAVRGEKRERVRNARFRLGEGHAAAAPPSSSLPARRDHSPSPRVLQLERPTAAAVSAHALQRRGQKLRPVLLARPPPRPIHPGQAPPSAPAVHGIAERAAHAPLWRINGPNPSFRVLHPEVHVLTCVSLFRNLRAVVFSCLSYIISQICPFFSVDTAALEAKTCFC